MAAATASRSEHETFYRIKNTMRFTLCSPLTMTKFSKEKTSQNVLLIICNE